MGIDDSRYRRRERSAASKSAKPGGDELEQKPDAAAIQKLLALYCACLQHALQVGHFHIQHM